jgi:hypothetical protein
MLTHLLNNGATQTIHNPTTLTQLVRMSYYRGFIYLAQVQGLISEVTNGTF